MRTELPPATSASQLVCYTSCARKYFFNYVVHAEPEFRSLNLVLGSAVHSATQWYFAERMDGREPARALAEDICAVDLEALSMDQPIRWKNETPASLEADGRRLVRTYLDASASMSVTGIEERFEVPLIDPRTGETFGRPLRGFFDFTLEDRVVELKTSSKGWNDFDLKRHLQVGSYLFASSVLYPNLPRVEVDVIVKLKGKPRVERHLVERTTSELGWWISAAGAIESAIQAGVFPPTPSPMCRECEFEKRCEAMGDTPQPVAHRRAYRAMPVVFASL
jgi:putative RecB family exonuclease